MTVPSNTAAIRELVARADVGARELAEAFDRLSLADAIAAARSLAGRGPQRALWHKVGDNPPICVSDLVPADLTPMRPVVFHGKNSLPVFTEFQKICCRPPSEQRTDVLWGYNETPIKSLVGPGYYVVHDTARNPFGGAAFDYRQLPQSHPAGWPDIRPNSAGLSRFVYNGMVDYMRRVSRSVFIGSATRGEREIDSYFVLVRELA